MSLWYLLSRYTVSIIVQQWISEFSHYSPLLITLGLPVNTENDLPHQPGSSRELLLYSPYLWDVDRRRRVGRG